MKVGIDANSLTLNFQNGTRRYTQELITALSKIDKQNEYILFSSRRIDIPKQSNFRLVVLPKYPIFKRQILLPLYVKKEKLDVFHNVDPYGSVFLKHANIVTTIHDIDLKAVYPTYKSLRNFITRIYSEVTRFFVIRNSKVIIFDTKCIMNDTKSSFGSLLKGKIIKLIHLAHSSLFDLKNTKVKNNGYVLCMGDFSPRKNIKNIFAAYNLLSEKYKTKYKLYLIASTLSESYRFKKLSEKYNLSKYIKIITAPSDKRLSSLYNSALCFLYPSLYEGFGLPILESMASGCPVITSNYGSMKEVAGSAALLVNPRSPKSIFDAVQKIINSNRTRISLIKKGYVRSSEFSWYKVATETLSIYKSI